MLYIYGYTKCSTVKKALKFLDNNQVEYTFVDFVQEPLSAEQLKEIHEKSNLPIKRMFNTSGMKYRELGLKDKVTTMSDEEVFDLLATDGMLVKRPIFFDGNKALIGFKEQEWTENI